MNSTDSFQSLERECVNGLCHCDWRLTVHGCLNQRAFTTIHGINVALCAIAIIVGVILLSHRIFVKGHTLFEINISKGCFRPKPIDCMLFFLIIFNALRLLSSSVLISNIFPDMISRSFLYELPWQFGFGAFALYLIGIAQTLADSHRVIANSWLPSPRLVDLIGGTIFMAPFIINNAMSLAAGILAVRQLKLAQTFTQILYVFWFIHCFSLALAVFFSGIRLIRILQVHLNKFKITGPRYVSVQTGIFKIRAVMTIINVCLIMFAVFLLTFGILRERIINHSVGSIVLCCIWSFLGVVATLCVEFAVIFNPKIDDNSLFMKTSSAEKSTSNTNRGDLVTYSNFSTQEYSATQSNSNYGGAQGTLSHNAFDELKLQQLQYQKVFIKHNQVPHKQQNIADSRQIKLSPSGIPSQDAEYEEEKNPFPSFHHQTHNLDDEPSMDDGETSQIDLVQHTSKN